MLKLIAMAFVLTAACVESTELQSLQAAEPPLAVERLYLTDGEPDGDAGEDCAMTVAEEGPCANACDEDWVRSFVPPGTCVAFECELTDGRTIRIGGCSDRARPPL